jgi:hypothetical protein
MISGLLAKPATTVQDAVEKQVFADCTDRGTTAAMGGKASFDLILAKDETARELPFGQGSCWRKRKIEGPHGALTTAGEIAGFSAWLRKYRKGTVAP